jgi:hypothetical protein
MERAISSINNFQFRDVRSTASICIHVIKQSLYRLGQVLIVPWIWGSHTSRQSAHEDGKFYSLTSQEIFLVLIYFRDWIDPTAIMWPGGLCQWKIFMTPSGIEPRPFCFQRSGTTAFPLPTCDQKSKYCGWLFQVAWPGSDFWEKVVAISVLMWSRLDNLAGELRSSLMRRSVGSALLFPLWSGPTQRGWMFYIAGRISTIGRTNGFSVTAFSTGNKQ